MVKMSKKPQKSGKQISKKTNLASKKSTKKKSFSSWRQDRKKRAEQQKIQDMRTLPSHPVKRFFARLHPKRVFRYVFSTRFLWLLFKIFLVCMLIGIIFVAGLFVYFKKDLAAIRPEELASHVQNTINTYVDRSGVILWEDKGSDDYRIVVDGDQISSYMRQATVAIEDRDFYNHPGISIRGLARALFVNLTTGKTQGGSTLTQQLIKQVYFSEEASDRTLSGLPRKIKEMILAVEVERMYTKEEIITLYLNESPYGGRRNGVESGAQTYFGKSSKDLTLAESALLAAIPNNPAVLNPYNSSTVANEMLVTRQHLTLDAMVDMGYITKEEADEAKAVPILDTILPEQSQYTNIKAPHFVLEVKKQLEDKYGIRTMRAGGWTITTTLDYRAQKIAEDAVKEGANIIQKRKLAPDNIAMASVDNETGQVIAMVGSIDFNKPVYGQYNAATSLVEPGSTIKPILDYLPLFTQRSGTNYGPGTIIKDENVDSIYCAGNSSSRCHIPNYTGRYYGNITLRKALANSLNTPAVKTLYMNGITNSINTVQQLGNHSFCRGIEGTAGLSIAVGGGCSLRIVEHANAYASVARGGVYKPLAYILELKNSDGDIVERWQDDEGERVVDPQVAYMLSSILSDASARNLVFGVSGYGRGFVIPNVVTGTKTGTTNKTTGYAKDNLQISYSPVVSMVAWSGKHDGGAWYDTGVTAQIPREVVAVYMERVHKEVYIPDGKYSANQDFSRPAGIQDLTVNGIKDIWPSWYNESNSGIDKRTLTFDSYTKKLATECTPAELRVDVEVGVVIDPITKSEIWYTGDYDKDKEDDVHICGQEQPPSVSISAARSSATTIRINGAITSGNHTTITYELYVDGAKVASGIYVGGLFPYEYTTEDSDTYSKVKIIIRDNGGYSRTAEVDIQ